MKVRLKEIDGNMYLEIPRDLVEEFSLEDGDTAELEFPDDEVVEVHFFT